MDTIQFETVVGNDNVLRIPQGILLPRGPLRVTVVSCHESTASTDELANTRDWLLEMAAEAERDPTPLPKDLAANHDHYAHGKPRQ